MNEHVMSVEADTEVSVLAILSLEKEAPQQGNIPERQNIEQGASKHTPMKGSVSAEQVTPAKRPKEDRALQEIDGNQPAASHSKTTPSKASVCEQPTILGVSQLQIAVGKARSSEEEEMCLVHNKVRDIVCTFDLGVICSNCAIFCHKGHDFKSLKDFYLDKLKHCQRLLELTDAKKCVEAQISSEQSQHKVQQQFCELRTKLLQQIKRKFAQISESVREAEERCTQRVTKALQQEEERIRNLMATPHSIDKAYRKWEATAYDQLKSFDTKDVQLQMRILNYDGKCSDDTVGSGERLLESLKKYQRLLEQKTSNSFTSFTLEFDNEVEKKLATIHETVLRKFKKQANISEFNISVNFDHNDTLNASSILNQTVIFDDLLLEDKKPRDSGEQTYDQSVTGQQSSAFFLPHASRTNRQLSVLGTTLDGKDSLSTVFMGQLTMIGAPPALKLGGSPMKDFVLPSPRCFVSPNKYRAEPVVDQKLKKTLMKLKLPDKYYRLVVSATTEPTEVFDLTHCGLDESTILALVELIRNNRSIKVLKLIRNRLTDEFVVAALPFLGNAMVLNLSQNHLTDRSLEVLASGISQLPSLRTVILTQNRVRERNWKQRIEELRRLNVSIVL